LLAPIAALVAALQSEPSFASQDLRATVTVAGRCTKDCAGGAMTLGAGVIIGRLPDGSLVVLTARHVIDGVARPQVYVRNGAEPGIDFAAFARESGARGARIIVYAKNVDLALVAFRPDGDDDYAFAALVAGDELGGARPGFVVGSPYGSLWTLSEFRVVDGTANTFRLDCATCGPGDSGGGVFDASGRLLGILVEQRIEGDDAGRSHRTSQFLAIAPAELRVFLDSTEQQRTAAMPPQSAAVPAESAAWVRFDDMRRNR